jgi:hypothetical protein
VILTCYWDDWTCFWHASISIRGRIFVSAKTRSGSKFKLFLCFLLIDARSFRVPRGGGYAYPRLKATAPDYKTVYSVESQPMFRRNIPPPSSGCKNKSSNRHHSKSVIEGSAFILVSWFSSSSTIMMEAICSSETSVGFSTDYATIQPIW